MATTESKPSIDNAIVNAITADTIWGETNLQYMFGGKNSLSLDDEFDAAFHEKFNGNPDAEFRYKAIANRAYDALSSVSGLTFEATTDAATADLLLLSSGKPIESDLEGFFNFPGTDYRDEEETDSWQVGVFNSKAPQLLAKAELGGGAYANWTVFHEIGHSMGLKHTHSEDEGLPPLPEIGVMDNERYSVMSYNGASGANKYGHAVTYMALDIAALQTLYGQNEAYAGGDSSYRLTDAGSVKLSLAEGDMSIGRAYACIWDTGGSDTISYRGRADVVLNLNAATLDTAEDTGIEELAEYVEHLGETRIARMFDAEYTAGGSFSFVGKNAGGYSIANGVIIEIAVGGKGDDILAGNIADNELRGGRGADVLFGNGGEDVLVGGKGRDTFIYSAGATIADFQSGVDVLVGDWPVG